MRSVWRTLGDGLGVHLDRATGRDIALVCLADALVGASFGAVAVSGGLPLWVPVLLSVLVFAGGAQIAAVGVVLAGGGPIAAVLAGLVLNARLLPFGFAVADALGRRWPGRLLGAHLITDESVAFTLQADGPRRRRSAFWVCGLALFTCWNVSVVAGGLAGRLVTDTDAFGLDAAFPAVLLALVVPALRQRSTLAAALLGAAVAVAMTPVLPAGLPVLCALAGLVALLRRTPHGTGGAGSAGHAGNAGSPTAGEC